MRLIWTTCVHRRFGLPTAINVGDYLIGLGYRLLSRQDDTDDLPAEVRVDVLDALANAHTRLAEGQGAELLWRDTKDRRLSPLDERQHRGDLRLAAPEPVNVRCRHVDRHARRRRRGSREREATP